MTTLTPVRRGTSNGNARGSAYDRRRRRAWLVLNYQSNVPGFCRCFRCGVLLFNPDDYPPGTTVVFLPDSIAPVKPLTIDRIIPGAHGGTYRRNNIRPACGACNSETGGATRSKA